MIGKNAQLKGAWSFIKLTKEETEKCMKELLEFNREQVDKCIEMAKDIVKTTSSLNHDNILTIALTLFEKQGMASYTYMSSVLTEKISDKKNKPDTDFKPAISRMSDEEKKEIENKAGKSLTAKKPKTESLLDQAYK